MDTREFRWGTVADDLPYGAHMTRWLALSVLTLVAGSFLMTSCDTPDLIAEQDDPCDELRDDEGGPVSIIIENARPTPVFFNELNDCAGTLDPLLTGPQGESLSIETSTCGACSAFLDASGGCFDGGDCFSGSSLIMLAPGSTAVLSWSGMELEPMSMPTSCDPNGDPAGDNFTCYRRKLAPSGRYTVHLAAIPSATCADPNDGSPKPCICSTTEIEGPNATCFVFDPPIEMAEPVEYVGELDYPNDKEVVIRIE